MVIKSKTVLSNCLGLNTILDPLQDNHSWDENGNLKPQYLAKAVNVRITDNSKVERSEVTTHLFDLVNGHSIFCNGGACLVHAGGDMYEVSTALELSASKRTGMSGEPVDHTQLGQAIYYGNRQERGIYVAGAHEAWAVDSYKGPVTTRQFATYAPIFDHLAAFNGMIIFSYDNHLFATEPGKPGLWEPKPIWSTDTRITMIKAVVTDTFPPIGGLYVSDEKRISYLGGLNPKELVEPRTTNYPAIEWSVAHGLIDGSLFGEKSGLCAVFATSQGLCIGYPDGQLVNITQGKIKMPSALSAGATAIVDHNIITTLR